MPILDSDIIWRPAALVSDTVPAQNGGRINLAATIASGVKNNLFPDVSQSERTAGATKWRKAFIHVNSAADVALQSVRVFLDALTPAGDYVVFHPGTQTDTEDAIAGRPYGVGTLAAPTAAGATSVEVLYEHADYATLQPFRVGDLVRIADVPGAGGAGNEEWVTVSSATYGASSVTLAFSPALVNAYATANTLVSSVYEIASVAASFSGVAVNSASGALDTATPGNLVAHNKGAIEQVWTLTFTSATLFIASGDTVGTLSGTGSISADFAPINPATGTPYFTLKFSAWGGSFAANDMVSFATHPAAIPVWYRRRVPAGSSSMANDYCSLAIHGESA